MQLPNDPQNNPHSACNLLHRATSLRRSAAGLATLAGAGAVEGAVMATGSGFHGNLSGIPDYHGFPSLPDGSLHHEPLGDGVKLWGSTGALDRQDLVQGSNYLDQPIYWEGVSLSWSGSLNGIFTGDIWDEDDFYPGDRMALSYEFTVNQSAPTGFNYEFFLYVTETQEGTPTDDYWSVNSANQLFSDTFSVWVEDNAPSESVSGTVQFDPFTFANEPVSFDGYWKLFLVVNPEGEDGWDATDTFEVIVPGNSIDMGVNAVPIPEPAAGLMAGGLALVAAVLLRKRAGRRRRD